MLCQLQPQKLTCLELPHTEVAKIPSGNVRQQALSPSLPNKWEVTLQTCSLTYLKACRESSNLKSNPVPTKGHLDFRSTHSNITYPAHRDCLWLMWQPRATKVVVTATGSPASPSVNVTACRLWQKTWKPRCAAEQPEPTECQPALEAAAPPRSWSAPSSAMLALQLAGTVLAVDQKQKCCTISVGPSSSQGSYNGLDTSFCRQYRNIKVVVPWTIPSGFHKLSGCAGLLATKMLATNYPCQSHRWDNKLGHQFGPLPEVLILESSPRSTLPFLPYLQCLIHVTGDERVRRTERGLQMTNVPRKFLMAINVLLFKMIY